jgi:TonB family protein
VEATLALKNRPTFPLTFALAISFGIHAVLIFALLASALFAPPRVDNSETIHVKLARLGTPRDAKLLPRKTEEPVQAPAPPVQVSKTVPVQSKTEPKPTDKKAPTNQDKLKNALAKLQKQVDQTGQTDGFETGTDDKTEGDLYWARVKDRIQRFFVAPNTIPDAERRRLVATMEIRIGADGVITDARTDHGSGNPVFDRALEAAIKRVRAFPPPPAHLAKQAGEGVSIEFHADKM